LTEAINPFISDILAVDSDTWLVQVVAGPETDAVTQLIPIDPSTGQPKQVAGDASAMPESVTCAQQTWQGQALCAWEDAVYAIDPVTGQPVAGDPLVVAAGQELYAVEVAGDLIITVGLTDTVPVATAFNADHSQLWSTPFGTDGCYLEDPANRVTITPAGDTIRLALVSQQALVAVADGAVLASLCGLAAYFEDGGLAVAQPYGDEPAPPATYVTTAGVTKTIVDAGVAQQLTAVTAGGQQYAVAVDFEGDLLRLVDMATGQQLWETDWQYGHLQTWDDQRLYLSGRFGLSGVVLATGQTTWTWQQNVAMAVRSAVLTRDGGLVVTHSQGVSGVTPDTGTTEWFVDAPDLAAYYWLPDGRDPQVVRQGNSVIFIGPYRDQIVRFDVPELTG